MWHYANPQVVFYNKDLLTRSGVPAPPADWTFQQWLDFSKRIAKPGDPATALWGTAAPTSFNYVFNTVRSFGGRATPSTVTVKVSPPAISTVSVVPDAAGVWVIV